MYFTILVVASGKMSSTYTCTRDQEDAELRMCKPTTSENSPAMVRPAGVGDTALVSYTLAL